MTGSAIQSSFALALDGFVAFAPLRKRAAFVAGNDERLFDGQIGKSAALAVLMTACRQRESYYRVTLDVNFLA